MLGKRNLVPLAASANFLLERTKQVFLAGIAKTLISGPVCNFSIPIFSVSSLLSNILPVFQFFLS